MSRRTRCSGTHHDSHPGWTVDATVCIQWQTPRMMAPAFWYMCDECAAYVKPDNFSPLTKVTVRKLVPQEQAPC